VFEWQSGGKMHKLPSFSNNSKHCVNIGESE
jgi:hypothetical protein